MQSNTTISGYLGATPQVRETPGGHRVTTVRVAVNDRRLSEDGIWFNVDQWDEAADRAAQYLVKGQHVTVEGLVDPRIYLDRNQEPRLDLTLKYAHISYGPKPVADEDKSPAPAQSEPGESRSEQSAAPVA